MKYLIFIAMALFCLVGCQDVSELRSENERLKSQVEYLDQTVRGFSHLYHFANVRPLLVEIDSLSTNPDERVFMALLAADGMFRGDTIMYMNVDIDSNTKIKGNVFRQNSMNYIRLSGFNGDENQLNAHFNFVNDPNKGPEISIPVSVGE